jgi:hypothetical protein
MREFVEKCEKVIKDPIMLEFPAIVRTTAEPDLFNRPFSPRGIELLIF